MRPPPAIFIPGRKQPGGAISDELSTFNEATRKSLTQKERADLSGEIGPFFLFWLPDPDDGGHWGEGLEL